MLGCWELMMQVLDFMDSKSRDFTRMTVEIRPMLVKTLRLYFGVGASMSNGNSLHLDETNKVTLLGRCKWSSRTQDSRCFWASSGSVMRSGRCTNSQGSPLALNYPFLSWACGFPLPVYLLYSSFYAAYLSLPLLGFTYTQFQAPALNGLQGLVPTINPQKKQ